MVIGEVRFIMKCRNYILLPMVALIVNGCSMFPYGYQRTYFAKDQGDFTDEVIERTVVGLEKYFRDKGMVVSEKYHRMYYRETPPNDEWVVEFRIESGDDAVRKACRDPEITVRRWSLNFVEMKYGIVCEARISGKPRLKDPDAIWVGLGDAFQVTPNGFGKELNFKLGKGTR